MNDQEAMAAVRTALAQVVPESDVEVLAPEAPLRETLDMDSLDFLAFVEQLADATSVRIDEDDYGRLTTVASCALFLQSSEGRSLRS